MDNQQTLDTPPGKPSKQEMISNLQMANGVAEKAMAAGRHPFGAILVAPDNKTVLLSQGNVNTVNHAEATLLRKAAELFSSRYLWECTLYTTVEPCAMCAGTLYWANVGKLVYGMSEKRLRQLTGAHEENPTLDLPCRHIFQRGQKPVHIWGPVTELEESIARLHQGFWTAG